MFSFSTQRCLWATCPYSPGWWSCWLHAGRPYVARVAVRWRLIMIIIINYIIVTILIIIFVTDINIYYYYSFFLFK